jgi:hypothetical protein
MTSFLENLQAFNRKERFFVVGWALGNPFFTLGNDFRQQIAKDTKITVPKDAFCAMDFHLDWLIGCLHLSEGTKESWDVLETGEVNASNDDIDLLVAFEAEGKTRLLLIEAKGVTGWHNKQLRKKAKRLGGIFGFGEISERWPWIDPTSMLASPREPVQIDVSEWPLWMKAEDRPQHWLELTLPPTLKKIVRCDQRGKRNADGGFWKVV